MVFSVPCLNISIFHVFRNKGNPMADSNNDQSAITQKPVARSSKTRALKKLDNLLKDMKQERSAARKD